jgi:hypothetical protein
MAATPPPATPEPLTALPSEITPAQRTQITLPEPALTPEPSSVASLETAICPSPCAVQAVRPSAVSQLACLTTRVAPFNFNLSAAAGLLLWFILFFWLADICPPYFARCVCRACRDDCGD